MYPGNDFKFSVLMIKYSAFYLILLIIFLFKEKISSRAKIYFKADFGSSRILKFERQTFIITTTNFHYNNDIFHYNNDIFHYNNDIFHSINSLITQRLKKLEVLRSKMTYYQIWYPKYILKTVIVWNKKI